MANRLQKQPVLTYVPAIIGVTGRAAFCEYGEVLYSYATRRGWETIANGGTLSFGWGENSGLSSSGTTGSGDSGGGSSYGGGLNSGPNRGGVEYGDAFLIETGGPIFNNGYITQAPSRPRYVKYTICYPAIRGIAAVPSRLDKTDANGWNGGARSLKKVPENSYLEVTLPVSPLGIMIGLSKGQYDYSYQYLDYAIVARPSGLTMVSNGRDISEESPLGRVVRFERRPDSTWVFVDDTFLTKTDEPVEGDLYAHVILHSIIDFVEDPVIGAYIQTAGTAKLSIQTSIADTAGGICLFSIRAVAIPVLDGVIQASGNAYLRMFSNGEAYVASTSSGTSALKILTEAKKHGLFRERKGLSPENISLSGMSYAFGQQVAAGIGSQSGHSRAIGRFSRPALNARINRPEAEASGGVGVFPYPLLTAGHILKGEILSGSGTHTIVGKASSDPYFGGIAHAATVYTLVAWEPYMPDGILDGAEILLASSGFELDAAVVFALYEGISITDSLDIYLVINLSAYDQVTVQSITSFSSVIELMIQEKIKVSSDSSILRKEALQYAVNAITGAVSLYKNFGFNQFASAGSRVYAINGQGLYELKGQSDNGNPLDASIDFGASDYGTAQSKRVSSVYAGISTDGGVYLRVTGDEGEERVYKATSYGSECRVVTAKGLAARHWRVRLELTDATFADLDNIEVEVGVSQRRLRSGR